jgi:hypothetical protein
MESGQSSLQASPVGNAKEPTTAPSTWVTLLSMTLALVISFSQIGCRKSTSEIRAVNVSQSIEAAKTKSDHLRDAFRYLQQLTPSNRRQASKEVLVQLNTWMETVPKDQVQYSTPALYQALPREMEQRQELNNPTQLVFDDWDVEYLFESQLMKQLSDWVSAAPVRDNLLQPSLDLVKKQLSPADSVKMEEAYKLFDWTTRNIVLEGEAKGVETLQLDPRAFSSGRTLGCAFMPWESVLFSRGDFVERGRVFTALARQRGIESVWIALSGTASSPGYLWALGVLIGNQIYVFDPKLGLPILDPDTLAFATLKDIREKDRILRRLDLPGQFDYAVNPGDVKAVAFMIDALPAAMSARIKILESSLLGSERMRLFVDTDAIQTKLAAIAPEDVTALWQVPVLARDMAAGVRERLESPSDFSSQYAATYGVWLFDTPAANARFKHLRGNFESSLEESGALAGYMSCRVDNETINRLAYDPDVQKQLGLKRGMTEDRQLFDMRVAQAQHFYRQAKVDANFLLAELHYDRGNYEATLNWLEKRILSDSQAKQWHATAHYLQGRSFEQLGKVDGLEAAYTFQPSAQEAGNRLRLRYLRREK